MKLRLPETFMLSKVMLLFWPDVNSTGAISYSPDMLTPLHDFQPQPGWDTLNVDDLDGIWRSTPLANSYRTTRSGRQSTHFCARWWLRLAQHEGCLNYVSPILACPAEGPSMGRMTWHQATPQCLEPVGPDRDYGTSVPRGSASCRAGLASSEYHGGLALQHRRWTGPTSLSESLLLGRGSGEWISA